MSVFERVKVHNVFALMHCVLLALPEVMLMSLV